MKTITRREYMFFGFVLLASVILVFTWFSPLNYHVFMGDDLVWIKIYHLSMPFWSMIGGMGKFRPVSSALIVMATGVCHDNYNCFVGIDLFMITVNAFLASIIAYKLTSKWMPGVLITSTVIILSRFSYYAALQVIGIMENLAMTFVLLLVLCFVHFMRSANVKWMAWIIVIFLLILLTHERFIVLMVPIVFSLFAKRKELNASQLIFFLSVLFLTTSGYFLIREYVFHSRFLTGAGASSIVDTFKISQVAFFISLGVLNLIGFNAGPDYLSGKFFLDAGIGGIIVGLFLSATLVILLYIFLKQQMNTKSDVEFGLVIVLILMISGMILASSITFRQEYRWLYTPFAVFVLLVCYFLGKLENLKIKYIMTLIIVVAFGSVDVFYRPYMHNLYLIHSEQVANSIKIKIIDKYNLTELAQKEIFLLIENDVVKDWTLFDNYFFDLYAPTIKVHYVKDLSEIPITSINDNHLLVFSLRGTQIIRIPEKTLQKRNMEFRKNNIVEYDFIANFPSAIWDGVDLVNTPNGHVVFLRSWADNFGLHNNTITIISPYNILFPSITCKEGSKLIFSAGIPNTSSGGADLFVDLESEGKQKKLLNVSLNPAEIEGVITWIDYMVPLKDCTEIPIAIKFGVSSPSGNSSTDWIAITNAKIVIDK